MKEIIFDPRCKIILFITSCLFTMNVMEFIPLTIFTTFIFILLLLSGKIKSGIIMYLTFLIGGSISIAVVNLPASIWAGIIVVFFSFFRLFLPTMMAFSLLFQSTKISEFMAAFEKLHIPYNVIIPFTVMFRFFPTIKNEWNGIRYAMSFRGIDIGIKGLVLHPIRSIEYILVPLLFSCVNIMDELVAASLARGLDSSKKRNCYFTLKMKFYDYIVIIFSLGFFIMMYID